MTEEPTTKAQPADQMAAWLTTLGLAEYARSFADNGVDLSVLPDLTDQDLKELGVLLGHRRKLLRAIRERTGEAAATTTAAAAESPPSDSRPAEGAERRQLTVMFCDLVGSTALATRLDPEEMGAVIRAYQQACAAVMAAYDGFLAKYMGDGVLAYFGYPRAHEDDAERAVRAGLDVIAAMARLETPARERLRARIGIATGLVVVGELIGEGAAQEQAVVGDTPNLAARLQALAEPGAIVIAASTRRLIGGAFTLRALGRHALKGYAEPVEAWAVEGVAASDSRFEARRSSRLTGFVGRDAELELLAERQRLAWQGQGQVVLVSGEAGIGKSRIAAWLGERVAATPHMRLRYQCSPHHSSSALYPFIAQIERAAGIRPEDVPDLRLDKLEAVLAMAGGDVAAAAPLFAGLLSIPTAGRYPPLGLSPAQQRRQTLAALLDQLENLARRLPIMFVFEDVHWADATSLELLDLTIERIRQLPVLAVITYRPEFPAPWVGLPKVTTLALARLDRPQVTTMVEQVTGGRTLPPEVLEQIIAKTDGIPLFVEELTKTVLEAGILVEDDGKLRLDGPLPPLAIPTTLQDSLMARLDRLAPVKEVAQIGAAIGTEFRYRVLQGLVTREPDALDDALAQLEAAELVYRHGAPPEARYVFKHALVQDAAYESLLKSRRQVLHRRIAETLRDRFPGTAETEPEVVAHHFTQAGLAEPAFDWWGKAGERALRRSAYVEAIAHFDRARALGAGLDAKPEQRMARLRLEIALGQALIAARGYTAPETAAAFARARELVAGIEDAAERFSTHYGVWVGHYVHGEREPMRRTAEEFLRDAERHPDSPEAGVAHRLLGASCWFEGDYLGARGHLERALAIFDPERDAGLAFRFGQDVGVGAMIYLALVLWPLGVVERARQLADAAMIQARNGGHVASLVYGHLHKALFEVVRHDHESAARHAATLVELSREHGLQQTLAMGMGLLGSARWRAGEREAGEREAGAAMADEALARLREQGVGVYLPLVQPVVTDIAAGQPAAGLAALGDALAENARTGQAWFDAELERQRAELHLRLDPPDPAAAEAAFRRAIAIAQRQQTKSFELRAALGLARLLHRAGRDDEAKSALAPIHAAAAEGAASLPEWVEASRLLDALADAERRQPRAAIQDAD